MKKSTAFLKGTFRKNFKREDNYRINGRKLAGLLDSYGRLLEEDSSLLISENQLLNKALRESEVKIQRMKGDEEATKMLADKQAEIILDYSNGSVERELVISKYRSYATLFFVLLVISLLALAYFVVTYTLNISIL